MVYPESVKKLEAIVTTDIQKTGHAEIVQGLIIRIRSVLRDAMNEQLGEARDVEAAIEVEKEYQVVEASVGFGENGSDGGLNENLGFCGGRGSDKLQDVADAKRNPMQRRRKHERPNAAHSAQHLRPTLISFNPLFNFFSLFLFLFHFSSHFSNLNSPLHSHHFPLHANHTSSRQIIPAHNSNDFTLGIFVRQKQYKSFAL